MPGTQDSQTFRTIHFAHTWRSAKQAAVRRYGEGPMADQAALVAVKHLLKRLAKRRLEPGCPDR